jgi:hypothetical protein
LVPGAATVRPPRRGAEPPASATRERRTALASGDSAGAHRERTLRPSLPAGAPPAAKRARTLDRAANDGLARQAGKTRQSLLGTSRLEQVNLEREGQTVEPGPGVRRRSTLNEDELSSEESSDGGENPGLNPAQRRARRRITLHLAEALDQAGTSSGWLESQSVTAKTRKTYREALDRFHEFSRRCGLMLRGDETVDAALVQFFTSEYFKGAHPSRGERTLAALMMLEPEFSQMGRRRVPRAWRALRGWKKLTPTVTRKPLPWPFWCGIALVLGKHRATMAVFVLMCVSGYFRPSELLSIRRCDLIAPAAGVLRHWSVLLFPEEENRASKTSQFDDSVMMDDERIRFLEPVWLALAKPADLSLMWDFDYHDFLAAFKRAAKELRVPATCPYQMRHSGPSIDLADERRSIAEAQRRGRWAQPRSMTRYERRARLAAEWAKVPEETRRQCEGAAAQLEGAVLGLFRRNADGSIRALPGRTS